jgi:hypothetical protein
VIAHLVLYELRPDISDTDRANFLAALEQAITTIPSVRGVRFGRRHTIGAGYEALAVPAFSFFALFEFDDVAGLQGYLVHASHVALGQLFWSCCVRTIVFDYDLAGDDPMASLRTW